MSDVETLQHRIEQAELRLKTAHMARKRESAALTAMWAQIRDRFVTQNAEIVRLRREISELQDTREQLSAMVGTLLGSIEVSIDRMADETVPRITGLAEGLLNGEEPDVSPVADPGDADAMAAQHTPEAAESTAADDFLNVLAEQFEDAEVPSMPSPTTAVDRVTSAPISAGIRDLISRMEGTFETRNSLPADETEEGDEELAQDLTDIRRLRDELQNLRARIGASH